VQGIVEHCPVAGLQACGRRERFGRAVVPSVAGMGATGDLEPDPVPAQERVCNWPQIKLDGLRGVRRGIAEAQDSRLRY
jgi:hypothetical protein